MYISFPTLIFIILLYFIVSTVYMSMSIRKWIEYFKEVDVVHFLFSFLLAFLMLPLFLFVDSISSLFDSFVNIIFKILNKED